MWVPAEKALLVGECVTPSSRKRDRIDKPARCAEAGIEYFMRVEVSYARQHAEDVLLRLEMAGIPAQRVVHQREVETADQMVDPVDADSFFILYDVYTISLAQRTRDKLRDRLAGKEAPHDR